MSGEVNKQHEALGSVRRAPGSLTKHQEGTTSTKIYKQTKYSDSEAKVDSKISTVKKHCHVITSLIKEC